MAAACNCCPHVAGVESVSTRLSAKVGNGTSCCRAPVIIHKEFDAMSTMTKVVPTWLILLGAYWSSHGKGQNQSDWITVKSGDSFKTAIPSPSPAGAREKDIVSASGR